MLATRNKYSASSLDQNPKHASSILLFGNFLRIPIPDIDRTQFLLVLGANPLVSGGSLMTAPGVRKRFAALRERGGRIVVVDPRRTETADVADEHWSIAPGDDAWLLAALVHTVLDEKLGPSGSPPHCDGREALRSALAPFAPESVAGRIGFEADRVRQLARDFCAAPSAVCYGRVGTCHSPYGTLNSWLVDVLNLVSGHFDAPGGAMFPQPAADLAALLELRGDPGHMARWNTRVRGAPCFNGEAPTACLAEEIATPGPGQVRGLLSIAGNPVLSAPNGRAVDSALAGLESYVAIDFYLNETTRHADLILPPAWSLEHDNYEVLFHGFAVRNTAKYSPATLPLSAGQRDDWQILTGLATRVGRYKAKGLRRVGWAALHHSPWLPSPRHVLDTMFRIGPHGDGFRPWRAGLRLRDLEAKPSGIDLGPLEPCLDEVLGGKRIDLAPPEILGELGRLAAEGDTPEPGLVLIGRRDIRTCNSWLHNTRVGTGGRNRCTLQLHPDEIARLGLTDGQRVHVTSRVGALEVPLEADASLRPGVACLPHGWGHAGDGLRLSRAEAHAGVSCNDLVDDGVIEGVVGNAVFSGVPIRLQPVEDGVEEAGPRG